MVKKILLADDSITIQKVVELTFSEGEYEIVCVGDGAQAIRKADEIVPDIALIDVMMPQRNGYDVCAHIKQDPKSAWIPVLLLTGAFEPFDPRRAEQAGANGHITKPFESRALVAQVEDLLAAHPRPRSAGGERAPIQPSAQPPVTEVVNAGQIFSAGPGEQPTVPRPAAMIEHRESSPSTVRLDSRAFFSQIQQPGDLLDSPAPPNDVPSLGPLDLATDGRETEPTGPVPAISIAAGAAAGSRPAGEETAGFSSDEIRRLVEEKITALARTILNESAERVFREMAWEILPEVAESLVRRRIRELESEAAGDAATAPPLH